jgi:hypothetical protein
MQQRFERNSASNDERRQLNHRNHGGAPLSGACDLACEK